jgi:serine/threonine protein kinase
MGEPVDRATDTLRGERGRYRVYDWVGGGGFGTVYYGRQLGSNRPVAVKRLHVHFVNQPRMVARFEREAALVLDRGLEHPNLVRVLDRGVDTRGVPFLVMEWVEGWTVAGLLVDRGGRLNVSEAAAIGYQALDGLAAAHSRGIVHRDVKPANLMVTREGQVRVMDLGIAKETEPEMAVSGSTNLGTWIYAPPEQIAGDALDGRADLYALAATLYHVLTGRAPFSGPSRELPPAEIERLRSDVPTDLCRVLHKALAFSRGDRFQNAAEMRDSLARFAPADRRFPIPGAETAVLASPGAPAQAITGPTIDGPDQPDMPADEPQAGRYTDAVLETASSASVIMGHEQTEDVAELFDPLETVVVNGEEQQPGKVSSIGAAADQQPPMPAAEHTPKAVRTPPPDAETVIVDELLTVPLDNSVLQRLTMEAESSTPGSSTQTPGRRMPWQAQRGSYDMRVADGSTPAPQIRQGTRWQGILCFVVSLLVTSMALSTGMGMGRFEAAALLAATTLILAPLAWWAITRNRSSGKLLAWVALALLVAGLLYVMLEPPLGSIRQL